MAGCQDVREAMARRRPRRFATLGVGLFAVVAAGCGGESDAALEAAPAAAGVEEQATTTTERVVTTTTEARSPEGASRAGDIDLADDAIVDALPRSAVVYEDIALLDSLAVGAEHKGGYERSAFPHWDDADGDGCDTRCEVLTSQRQPDGSWYSAWDGATEVDPSLVHVDHVVALAEAWRSGAHAWTAAQRDEFADDRRNLLAVTEASNVRKRDADASSWFPSDAESNCLWARTVVLVKSTWQLSVDPAEKDALRNLLTSCGAVPPTTTTTTPPPPPPPPPAPVAAPPAPAGDCTPGYSPCLPPASDYDCSSGSGNGPAYTGRVSVDHGYGDPYDLDGDGDGVGCE